MTIARRFAFIKFKFLKNHAVFSNLLDVTYVLNMFFWTLVQYAVTIWQILVVFSKIRPFWIPLTLILGYIFSSRAKI